ncbi:class I SAM-dependent methyltransferase [Laribacter hongkongensis]|uniref:class I SAM-dependent methyltransferase n=1 Tax=Laribacter hongkongensis TaxID=168471 RepID=UPI001EFD8494|nr:class I SAM-dependent methyltransferase [Laribacter hongkongensis]MCG9081340.1 class I SAM-dependent methyltransferase [Laribacter hongkongensis]
MNSPVPPQTSATRVLGEKLELREDKVLAFFEGRGARYSIDHPLTTVLYQDQSPQIAEERDRYEKFLVLPKLALDGRQNVLDVGCGIGRWADAVLPQVATYQGVDFSPSLVAIASDRWRHESRARFNVLSADRLSAQALGGQHFDRIIVAGLMLYLNDDQVARYLSGLMEVAGENCLLYIREPLGVTERLTLNAHPSDELQQEYSAIYRGLGEMQAALDHTLVAAGFRPAQFEPLYPAEGRLNNRVETRQYWLLASKGEVPR